MTTIPGGLWFKDHCLKITPNKNNSGIRYRYSGEDWKTVEGDDYEIQDDIKGQCLGNYQYLLVFDVLENHRDFLNPGQYQEVDASWFIWLKPYRIIASPSNPIHFKGLDEKTGGYTHICTLEKDVNGTIIEKCTTASTNSFLSYVFNSHKNIDIRKYDYIFPNTKYLSQTEDNCGTCTLSIYKDEEIVYQETRNVCPEVERINNTCSSDNPIYKQVRTAPLGFIATSRREVNNRGESIGAIPDECRNIYNVGVTVSLSNIQTPVKDTGLNYQLVGQYCSSVGCEPPTVKEEGKCCESCPNGTCPVTCNDHVCCYDQTTGNAVLEIPLENYCQEGN